VERTITKGPGRKELLAWWWLGKEKKKKKKKKEGSHFSEHACKDSCGDNDGMDHVDLKRERGLNRVKVVRQRGQRGGRVEKERRGDLSGVGS